MRLEDLLILEKDYRDAKRDYVEVYMDKCTELYSIWDNKKRDIGREQSEIIRKSLNKLSNIVDIMLIDFEFISEEEVNGKTFSEYEKQATEVIEIVEKLLS